ncbi:MAG: hypothetical protein ABI051_16260 [Vicinamibacterales bacterium]
MYGAVLLLHSYVRWLVLLAGILAVARAFGGVTGRRAWTPADDRAGRMFNIILMAQFLLGMLLYIGLSPITQAAMRDLGAAMRNPVVRFFVVEHLFGMLVAMALANIGKARIRRARHDERRHRTALTFYGIALLAILASIPWPLFAYGRPLLRY